MGSVPLVALSLRQPKREGILNRYGRLSQLQSMAQGRQLTEARLRGVEQQNQARARALQEQDDVDNFLDKRNGDIRSPEAMRELMQISPKTAFAYQKLFSEFDNLDLDKQKKTLEVSKARREAMASIASGINDKASQDAGIAQALQRGLIDEQSAAQMGAAEYDPENIKRILRQGLAIGKVFDVEDARLRRGETERRNRATGKYRAESLAAPTGRMKEFQAEYETYLKATDLPRTAKTEREFRVNEFNPSRRTVIEKPPSKTAGASIKRAANKAIAAAQRQYVKLIQELNQFIPDPADPSGEQYIHREDFTQINKADWLAQRREAKANLDAAIQAAEASEQEELEFLGFEGQPVNEGPQEGDTAFNEQTGKKVVLRGGQWVPVQ